MLSLSTLPFKVSPFTNTCREILSVRPVTIMRSRANKERTFLAVELLLDVLELGWTLVQKRRPSPERHPSPETICSDVAVIGF